MGQDLEDDQNHLKNRLPHKTSLQCVQVRGAAQH